MIQCIAAITLIMAIIFTKCTHDVQLWKKAKNVNHRKEWLIVAGCSIPAIVVFFLHCDITWFTHQWINQVCAVAVISGMFAWFIWLLFDGIYNLLRNFSWWFTGSDDPDDAKTDNFLQKLPLWAHISIKIGGLLLFTTLYIIYFKP